MLRSATRPSINPPLLNHVLVKCMHVDFSAHARHLCLNANKKRPIYTSGYSTGSPSNNNNNYDVLSANSPRFNSALQFGIKNMGLTVKAS